MPFFSMYTVLNDMTPNDSKAGASYRECYPESELCKMCPNDFDLGAKIRTLTEVEFNKITYPESSWSAEEEGIMPRETKPAFATF
jgi:hypothetical protein